MFAVSGLCSFVVVVPAAAGGGDAEQQMEKHLFHGSFAQSEPCKNDASCSEIQNL